MNGLQDRLGAANGPASDRPENEDLRVLVDLARSQSTPMISVSASEVHNAWQTTRARTRLRVAWMVAAAAMALFTLRSVDMAGLLDPQAGSDKQLASAERHSAHGHTQSLERRARPAKSGERVEQTPATFAVGDVSQSAESWQMQALPSPSVDEGDVRGRELGAVAVTLADEVSLVERGRDGQLVVLSEWKVEVAAGVYRVQVDATASQSAVIVVGNRQLEVQPGAAVLVASGRGSARQARLIDGRAAWIDADGNRSELTGEREPDEVTAAMLARQADEHMAAGRREAAVETFETLIAKYPRSAAARTALLDLGRLLRLQDEADRARCVYELYLERFPRSRVRAEVEQWVERLGQGPSCRGTRPR